MEIKTFYPLKNDIRVFDRSVGDLLSVIGSLNRRKLTGYTVASIRFPIRYNGGASLRIRTAVFSPDGTLHAVVRQSRSCKTYIEDLGLNGLSHQKQFTPELTEKSRLSFLKRWAELEQML